ncbi:MAG: SLC13 family permease [Balneolales bacterium]|nr:SLC13 family permease [Balneolales bacterium]
MANINDKGLVNYPFIITGIVFFFAFILFFDLKPGSPEVTYTAAIAILMAFWWVTEALPIGATSLLPIVLFPVFGIMDGRAISDAYINYVIFLFIGGFIMALAIEKWGLHKRIALKILTMVGGKPLMILFGFMLASAFLSMWMSNTATAMMMLPIALSVVTTLDEETGEGNKSFSLALLLGVAYACSLGGLATLVGTPPNLSFVRIFEIIYPNGPEISFGHWFFFASPLFLLLFIISVGFLYLRFLPRNGEVIVGKDFFQNKYDELGKMKQEERRVLVMFITLALLWIFRKSLTIGPITIPGWSNVFENPGYINDGTIAIFVALLLFIIPSTKKREGLVTWEITRKIPWGIVLLFGGGFALASGFINSGLSNYIGSQLEGASRFPAFGLILTSSGLMTFLTEFTSNTASTEMMLPIISSVANTIEVNPLLLMIPITLAASMAFMFPIATPPNAIIYGSGRVSMMEMAKTGFALNILAILLISVITYFWAPMVFDIDLTMFPEWATQVGENGH